jgi:hypothetical protein
MVDISSTTNLSNWTLSLIIGITAALTSGSQQSMVGELPFSDLLLTMPYNMEDKEKTKECDTVLISKKNVWANIIHKSLWMKGLQSLHITIDDQHECHIYDKKILPNMFYGLLSIINGVVCVSSPEEILELPVDVDSCMYLRDNTKTFIGDKTNEIYLRDVIGILQRLCDHVGADESIMRRIITVASGEKDIQDDKDKTCETVDRIFSRILPTLDRHNISAVWPNVSRRSSINVRRNVTQPDDIAMENITGVIGPDEFVELLVVALGIRRAMDMSKDIIDGGIVIAGYNTSTAHEIVADLTELPAEEHTGYSRTSFIETTNRDRIIDKKVDDRKTLLMPLLEVALTLGILYFSSIGPLLSMYVSRQFLAPYRESTLRRGSSMKWSIKNVKLRHTGVARDDWLVSIKPADNVIKRLQWWKILTFICCIVPFMPVQWWVRVSLSSNSDMERAVSLLGIIGTFMWIGASCFAEREGIRNSGEKFIYIKSLIVLFPLVYITTFFFAAIFCDINSYPWLYKWFFEITVGLIWMIGEIMEGKQSAWIVESTSFFLMGVLSAFRLVQGAGDI